MIEPDDRVIFESPYNTWDRTLNSWVPGGVIAVVGRYLNDSVNNQWYKYRGDGGLTDRGSNWTAMKCAFGGSDYDTVYTLKSDTNRNGYQGPLMTLGNTSYADTYPFLPEDFLAMGLNVTSEEQLAAYGATAISRVQPTNPLSDLPVAIGELLFEGLPKGLGQRLLRDHSVVPSAVADEYLNFTFGIEPFVRDLQSFWQATSRAQALIADYAKRSGRLTRRRYQFTPDIEITSDTSVNPDAGGAKHLFVPGLGGTNWLPDFGGTWGTRVITKTVERQVWFSGAFTYYLPEVGEDFWTNLRREYAEIRHLYGGLSASTAWNLIPFSWAADWFTNAGDVIANVDAFSQDGLVMPWGYVMELSRVHEHHEVFGARPVLNESASSVLPPTISRSFDVQVKRRRKATPFGFGFDYDVGNLTGRQQAILVALGLTH